MTTTTKFKRSCLLSVQGSLDKTKFYSITQPLTIEFDVVRNTFASPNSGRFRIYNLSENVRKDIFHVRYDSDEVNRQRVQFFVGYETNQQLPLIFLGDVFIAGTKRIGPDWITDIDCFDGGVGMNSGQISLNRPAGWTAEEILTTLFGSMPYVKFGAIGDIHYDNSRGISMVGNAWEIAERMVGEGLLFIDNHKAYAINENEFIVKPGQIELILGPNNIIGTPRREGAIIEVDMILEPSVFIGQAVTINSLETVYNDTYKLMGIHHRGTISGAVCGEAITTLSLWTGTKTLRSVQTK